MLILGSKRINLGEVEVCNKGGSVPRRDGCGGDFGNAGAKGDEAFLEDLTRILPRGVPLLLTGDASNIAFAVSRRGGDAMLFLDGLFHNGERDDDGCFSVPFVDFLALLALLPRISVNFRLGLGRGIDDMPAA